MEDRQEDKTEVQKKAEEPMEAKTTAVELLEEEATWRIWGCRCCWRWATDTGTHWKSLRKGSSRWGSREAYWKGGMQETTNC